MNKSLLSASSIIILGGILLFVNGLSSVLFRSAYLDLTGEGLYSLSPGSKNILKQIQSPIKLRYFFSRTDAAPYASLKLYGSRVQDLLREYERHSGGKLVLEIYDPRPDSEEQEWADKYGLSPIPEQSGKSLYFGLTGVNAMGQEASIPLFNLQRQEFLEYDVTKVIYSLMKTKKPVVGIISTLPVKGTPRMPYQQMNADSEDTDPWVFYTQLQEFYDVRNLETTAKEIPSDVDLLMVIHPKDLTPETLYAIDQFVLRGKALFVAVDPYCQLDQPPSDPANPYQGMTASRSSTINKLLSNWGVELVEKKVVADIGASTKVSVTQGMPPKDYLVWLSLRKPNMNSTNVSTSLLENVLLPWSGALDLKPKDGVTEEVLLSSSDGAMLVKEEEYRFGGGDPDGLLRSYQKGSVKQNLAVNIRGKLKTNFPGGPPTKTGEGEKKEESSSSAKPLLASQGTSNVVVVADVDFLGDNFSVVAQKIFGRKLVSLRNDNLVFLLNVIENQTGSDDLISIRSRGTYSRPFTKVQDIEIRAEQRWQAEEMTFQAKLNEANQRLSQMQNAAPSEGGHRTLSREAIEEIKKLREDRNKIQRELRNVRRNLREDKERLGTWLFFVNTFAIPLILIFGTVGWAIMKKRTAKRGGV